MIVFGLFILIGVPILYALGARFGPPEQQDQIRKTRTPVTIGAVVLGLVLMLIGAISGYNGVRNEGIDREAQLTAQYSDNQNELSTFLNQVHEQFQISDIKADKLDAILTDAVKGRYEGGSTAQPSGGKLISAVVEAYPDLKGLDSFDKLMDTISAGRSSYKGVQSKLLDMLRSYDTWRRRGIFRSTLVRMAGFPSDGLEARIPGVKTLHGDAARDQMFNIVLSDEASNAYTTGRNGPVDFGGK